MPTVIEIVNEKKPNFANYLRESLSKVKAIDQTLLQVKLNELIACPPEIFLLAIAEFVKDRNIDEVIDTFLNRFQVDRNSIAPNVLHKIGRYLELFSSLL